MRVAGAIIKDSTHEKLVMELENERVCITILNNKKAHDVFGEEHIFGMGMS
jgi:hypothetical protein